MCRNSCLCWRDLMTPSIAVVIFSMTTSMNQILIQVAVFTGNQAIGGYLSNSDVNGTAAKLYVALAGFDFFVILFGAIFMMSVERNGGHRYTALPWIIWIIFYIIYESAVNIFYFTQDININGISSKTTGYYVVPLVYWIVKDVLLFIGWWCVVSRLCYWGHSSTLGSADSTLLLTRPTAAVNGIGPTDSFGPIYYNGGGGGGGGDPRGLIRDQLRSSSCAHFDAGVRPTSSFQVYSPNWGGNVAHHGRNGGVYGPVRYVYQ